MPIIADVIGSMDIAGAGSMDRVLEYLDDSREGTLHTIQRNVVGPAVLAHHPPREGWGELLQETAAALREPEGADSREGLEAGVHAALATAACHAACRKGDLLDVREVQALLEALDRNVWFPTCPHGRPTELVFTREELDRQFKRT